MKSRYQIYLAIWALFIASSITLYISFVNIQKYVLPIFVIILLLNAIFEFYFCKREHKFIQIIEDIDPRRIKIKNNGYEVIENCVIKFKKLQIIGSNQICQRIDDNSWDLSFCWVSDKEIETIPNGESVLLNLYNPSDEKIELTLRRINIPLQIYRDYRNGEQARIGKYQLEIEIWGTGKIYGGTDKIRRIWRCQILYKSRGPGYLPTFRMQEISKLSKPNGIIADEQVPSIIQQDITLE